MRRIPTFKAGTHRDLRGVERPFTPEDLAATAAAYDPALAPAQLVKGHPKLDDPSFGQVGRFVVDADGVLCAEDVQNLEPAFAADVETGRFPSRSIKFYAPGDAANPVPGVWYPRHIGFLGAHPPAVKGLPAVEFADGQGEDIVVAFAEDDLSDQLAWPVARLFGLMRRVRDFIVAERGAEAAEAILSASELDWGTEDLAVLRGRMIERERQTEPAFSEPTLPHVDPIQTPAADAAPTDAERAITAREEAIAAREVAFSEQATTRVRDAFERELEAIAGEGRLIGTDQADVVAFCEAVGLFAPGDAGAGVEVAFGEGDTARTEGALDFISGLLRRLPVEVAFGEVGSSGVPTDTSDPAGIAKRATAYQAEQATKGVTVSATEAVRHVTAQAHA